MSPETTLHFKGGPAAGATVRADANPPTLRVSKIGKGWRVSDEGVLYERFAVDRSPGSCIAFYQRPS